MRRFPDFGVGSEELVAPAEVELQPRGLRAAELPVADEAVPPEDSEG